MKTICITLRDDGKFIIHRMDVKINKITADKILDIVSTLYISDLDSLLEKEENKGKNESK
jgi:hypothetical protein